MNILSLSALIKFGRIWVCIVVVVVDSIFFLSLLSPCHFVMWFLVCVCVRIFLGKIKHPNANAVCDRAELNWTLLDWVDQNSISQPYWGWLRGNMTITTFRSISLAYHQHRHYHHRHHWNRNRNRWFPFATTAYYP